MVSLCTKIHKSYHYRISFDIQKLCLIISVVEFHCGHAQLMDGPVSQIVTQCASVHSDCSAFIELCSQFRVCMWEYTKDSREMRVWQGVSTVHLPV